MLYLLILPALLFPAQRPARGRVPEISVPQGWTVQLSGLDLLVEHSSGASLRVVRRRLADDLQNVAARSADGIAYPLGFAEIGPPRHFVNGKEEWVQYEIRGNRLAAHRRILYRAKRDPDDPAWVIETIYENSEAGFSVLLTEAQSIATQFLSQ
jgi:hypothetical protein